MPHIPLGEHLLYYRRQLHQSAAWRAVELADGAICILRQRDRATVNIPIGNDAAGFRHAFAGACEIDRRRDGQHAQRDRLCALVFEARAMAQPP